MKDVAHTSRIQRTLWRIETRLAEQLSLADLAKAEGISTFHLTRAFALVTGVPLMRYVRARRLSEAARQLAQGNDSVLHVALDAGYDSHEGFSRAFRDMFSCAPSDVRSGQRPDLQEPFEMEITKTKIAPPKIMTSPGYRIVGIAQRYTFAERTKIPALWERAIQEIGPAMFGTETYGVSYDFEDGAFKYLVGILDDGRVDTERLEHIALPAGRYAVFEHEGHISEIASTWSAIFENWAPDSGETIADGPEYELYAKDFSIEKPGGPAIWIPLVSD